MTAPRLSPDELGAQLKHPKGNQAHLIGDLMFASNAKMIFKTIDLMRINAQDKILEIGFGNGKHVPYLLAQARDVTYHGIEISEAMIEQACANNPELVESGIVNFVLNNKLVLAQLEEQFNSCFSINSIYFWEDPAQYFHQIYRSLKPGGELIITCIDKTFGQELPFTQHGFHFLNEVEVKQLMDQASFQQIQMDKFIDHAVSKDGQQVDRPYWVARGIK